MFVAMLQASGKRNYRPSIGSAKETVQFCLHDPPVLQGTAKKKKKKKNKKYKKKIILFLRDHSNT